MVTVRRPSGSLSRRNDRLGLHKSGVRRRECVSSDLRQITKGINKESAVEGTLLKWLLFGTFFGTPQTRCAWHGCACGGFHVRRSAAPLFSVAPSSVCRGSSPPAGPLPVALPARCSAVLMQTLLPVLSWLCGWLLPQPLLCSAGPSGVVQSGRSGKSGNFTKTWAWDLRRVPNGFWPIMNGGSSFAL
ncbi:hypothetical protein SKAU_G00336070 [Synaphobranchus kaupii]|uniref:Uncharacterized protein n=1 Tax=Synaphobranchus kaupii TaxID=118154 RepID=A0A9Q1EM62_SYNKA|nr:hypothetical protein SKAU_G00336070 [Synaphobranchus kaupii]